MNINAHNNRPQRKEPLNGAGRKVSQHENKAQVKESSNSNASLFSQKSSNKIASTQGNNSSSKSSSLFDFNSTRENLPSATIEADTYAQNYADANGLTLDKAKEELKSKFGEPTEPSAAAKDGIDPGVDPDTYAQNYATEHGLTLEAAKEELKAKYGDPEAVEEAELEETEEPDSSVDPDTYAQNYATEHGLTLEAAKEEMRIKFGDPTEQEEYGYSNEYDFDRDEFDPERIARDFADRFDMDVDEAMDALLDLWGIPEY